MQTSTDCLTLTQKLWEKEYPCYTQIGLRKILILEVNELQDEWPQCGLINITLYQKRREIAIGPCLTIPLESAVG